MVSSLCFKFIIKTSFTPRLGKYLAVLTFTYEESRRNRKRGSKTETNSIQSNGFKNRYFSSYFPVFQNFSHEYYIVTKDKLLSAIKNINQVLYHH